MRKIYFKKLSLFICVILLALTLYFCMFLYFGFQTENFRTDILFKLSENVLNLQCIPYAYLDDKYKEMVSEECYNQAQSPEEIVKIYRLFNKVPYQVRPTTEITTDGFKTYAEGIVEIEGKKYELEHHIDFTTKKLKPYVIKWYIDITLKK